MKYYDIKTLFKREVKCDKDFKEFVKALKISDNMLKRLNYDGYIDYCYGCNSYHVNDYMHKVFETNVTYCKSCHDRSDRIRKFKKEIL
jgi:hypothetical protein